NRLFEVSDSLLGMSGVSKQRAQIELSVRILRVQIDCGSKVLDCGRLVASVGQHQAPVALRVSKVALDFKRPLKFCDSAGHITTCSEGDAQIVVYLGVIGI